MIEMNRKLPTAVEVGLGVVDAAAVRPLVVIFDVPTHLFSKRGLAWIVDLVLAVVVIGVVGMAVAPAGGPTVIVGIAILAAVSAYYVVVTGVLGWTPGKRLVGFRVIRVPDGRRPGIARASLRLVGAVPAVPLGLVPFLSTLVGDWPVVLRDRVSRTLVVTDDDATWLAELEPAEREQLLRRAFRAHVDPDEYGREDPPPRGFV